LEINQGYLKLVSSMPGYKSWCYSGTCQQWLHGVVMRTIPKRHVHIKVGIMSQHPSVRDIIFWNHLVVKTMVFK